MFGAIIASRPVITEFQKVSPTQLALNVPSQPPFSHIVIFLLPGNTLDANAAAAVYVQIPPSTEFQLLGAIANEKQSAIFRINQTGAGGSGSGASISNAVAGDDVMIDEGTAQPVIAGQSTLGGPNIVIGISIEPAANVEAQLAALRANNEKNKQAAATSNTIVPLGVSQQQSAIQSGIPTKILAQKIIKNAFNFLSSFGNGESVPMKAFQDWWTKFEGRIERDPGFLERADDP